MAQIVVDGRGLNYELAGPEGAPVVMFSNSLGADLGMWALQRPALESRYRVLRYDTRGHGASEVVPGDHTMESLAQDALALIDNLALGRVRFCGLSMGGAIGQWLGANAPDRLERLVIANSGAVFATPGVWQQRIDLVRAKGMGAVVDGTLERWLTEAYRAANPDMAAKVRAMLMAVPAEGYAGCCAALRDVDYRPSMARIAVPTLVIAGDHDAATPPARAEELAAAIPGARLERLDAAHFSALEKPEAFNALLSAFFA